MKRILVLAPHTDDGELGCGGTIDRCIAEGDEVYYVAFSTCKDSVSDGFPEDILEIELRKAMNVLKVIERNIYIFDYKTRRFSEQRQNILDDMISLGRKINPDLVFAPSLHDIHQDHHVIAKEAMRAFKKTTLLGYEEPWNNYEFNNQAYFILSEENILKKVEAIRCYKTQENRPYANNMFIMGQAKMHGIQIGADYAEVFEVMRLVQ